MSIPKRLVVEYDDGSTKAIPFNNVDRQVQFQLAKSGLCPPPSGVGSSKQYLLFQWQDGWQEVVGMDSDVVELLRYYSIERIEYKGKLILEVGSDYPEVFVIGRRPRELTSLLIAGSDGTVKSYQLESEVKRREGFLDEGGKNEFVKFDKKDPRYPHEFSEEPEALTKIMDSVKKELGSKGLSPQQVLAVDESERIDMYKEVAKGIGVRAKERQEDVYGFIEMMVRLLDSVVFHNQSCI
jgi:hypothetical protein